eukprot:jgi/Mesvir1/24901/Mv22121-RA.3
MEAVAAQRGQGPSRSRQEPEVTHRSSTVQSEAQTRQAPRSAEAEEIQYLYHAREAAFLDALIEAAAQQQEHKARAAQLERELQEMRSVLKEPLEKRDEKGNTALHDACRKGCMDVVKYLVAAGANMEARNENGSTPLSLACTSGHLETVLHLITNGADVNAKDKDGNTPLHLASQCGHLPVVEMLIDASAGMEAKNQAGRTPLHMACDYGRRDIVAHLLAMGVDIKAEDKEARTPLLVASVQGHLEIVQLLVANGANVAAREKVYGGTPLHFAALLGHLDVIQCLLGNSADKDAQSIEVSSSINLWPWLLRSTYPFEPSIHMIWEAHWSFPWPGLKGVHSCIT